MGHCKECGANSDSARFYASNTTRCVACVIVRARANRAANLEYYLEYDRKRAFRLDRVEARRRYQAIKPAYARKSDPAKRAVHIILGNAVRAKRIAKPKLCDACGRQEHLDGHHYDYTKPLEVAWVCKPCHGQIHRYENDLARRVQGVMA